jgi:hypothetical protein
MEYIFRSLTTLQQWNLILLLIAYYSYKYTEDNYHEYECGEYTDNVDNTFFESRLFLTN